MKHYQLFINGEFVNSESREVIEVINPSTEEVISYVPQASEADVEKAVESAKYAQRDWAKLPSVQRANYLRAIAQKIRENEERFIEVISQEQGKIRSLAQFEVNVTADYMDYMAEWARRYEGEILQSDRPNENILIFKQPIGVIAGILPWNFPFALIARKVAPALVTGNTIVLKPSEDTPNNAFEFASLVAEVGLPAGVINVVSGDGNVGKALVSNKDIGMVSFTGSVETGSNIMSTAAKNITKVSLELGGKAPAIVMDDADLDNAVEAIVQSRIANTGQVCNCAERVYVQERVYDEFVEKYINRMSSITYGDPLTENVDMGPLVNKVQLESVERSVRNAQIQGAEVALGGKRGERSKGYFYEPTVLLNCRQDMDIVRQEVFGPVTPIVRFETLNDAIEMANDSEYGLTSSIYSKNLNTIMRACNELKFGETYVNRENSEAFHAFHGGWRKSGIGGDDGKHGLEEYLQLHVVYIQY